MPAELTAKAFQTDNIDGLNGAAPHIKHSIQIARVHWRIRISLLVFSVDFVSFPLNELIWSIFGFSSLQ